MQVADEPDRALGVVVRPLPPQKRLRTGWPWNPGPNRRPRPHEPRRGPGQSHLNQSTFVGKSGPCSRTFSWSSTRPTPREPRTYYMTTLEVAPSSSGARTSTSWSAASIPCVGNWTVAMFAHLLAGTTLNSTKQAKVYGDAVEGWISDIASEPRRSAAARSLRSRHRFRVGRSRRRLPIPGGVSLSRVVGPAATAAPVGGLCPCYDRDPVLPGPLPVFLPWIDCPNFSSRSRDARPGVDLGVATGCLEREAVGTECGPSLVGPGADCRLPFCFGWHFAAIGCALLAPSVLPRRPACIYFSDTCESLGSPLHPPLPAPRPFG